jgi:drug/metabolite transporter (DMT)-like permease
MALGSSLVQGIASIFAREYIEYFPASRMEYLILGSFFIFLIPLPFAGWAIIKKKTKIRPSKKFITWALGVALSFDLGNIIYIFALDKYDSALFYPIMSLGGIAAAITAGYFIFKEKIGAKAYIGMAVSAGALYILSM